MERLKNYYEQIVSQKESEEILEYVRHAPNKTKWKKRAFKTIMSTGAVAAAFFLMVICVGASGVLDFNQIFKRRMSVSDNLLGSELIGAVDAFVLNVPGEEQDIVFNGIIGSNKNVLISFDVVRKDGTPMVDSFTKETKREEVYVPFFWDWNVLSSVSYHMYINEAGNITVYVEGLYNGDSIDSLDDVRFVFNGSDFYDYDEYERCVERMKLEGKEKIISAEIGEYLVTLGDWSVEFIYHPSEKGAETICLDNLNVELPVTFSFYKERKKGVDELLGKQTLVIAIKKIELSSIGGVFTCYVEEEFAIEDGDKISYIMTDKIYLIMENGEKVPVMVAVGSAANRSEHNGMSEISAKYCELKAEAVPKAVDVTKVKSIFINGEVFDF